MKKYKLKMVPTKQGAFVRRRIDSNRSRAELVGMIYLIATLAISALACGTLLLSNRFAGGAMHFWKVLLAFDYSTNSNIVRLATAAIYAVMLVVLLINVLRAFTHLKYLFKKKVSRVYGLNSNISAMDLLGNIFSGSLICITIAHFAIYMLAQDAKIVPTVYVLGAIGIIVHILCGFWGSKVSAFYIDEEKGVREAKRPFGRIIPLIRNVLQIAAVFAIGYFILKHNTIYGVVSGAAKAVLAGDSSVVIAHLMELIPVILEVLSLLCLFVMIAHAFGTSEYSIEGPKAPGIRNFRIASLLTFLFSGAAVVYRVFGLSAETFIWNEDKGHYAMRPCEKGLDMILIYIAAIALVMVLVDIIFRLRWTKAAREEYEDEMRQIRPQAPRVEVKLPAIKPAPVNVHVPRQEAPKLPPIQVNVPRQHQEINVHVPRQHQEINVHVPRQKLPEMPPIQVNVPRQELPKMPDINVHVPKQELPKLPDINVNVPKQQIQAAPITVNVPRQQLPAMPPIQVNIPKQETQMPPIQVNIPKQEAPKMPDVVVNVPKQQVQAAPITVNIPKQEAPKMPDVVVNIPKQQMLIETVPVSMPSEKTNIPPINVYLPKQDNKMPPIEVNVPSQSSKADPIEVNVSESKGFEMAPINVNVSSPQTVTPIHVNVPKQDVKEGPIIMVPISAKKGERLMEKGKPVVAVSVSGGVAPKAVMAVPTNANTTQLVMIPSEKQQAAPITVNVPAAKMNTPIDVQIPASKMNQSINVHVPATKANAAPVNVTMPPVYVNVTMPEQKQEAPNVTVNVPKQEMPNVTVNVPKQEQPANNITVNVPEQKQAAPAVAPVYVNIPEQKQAAPAVAPIYVNIPEQKSVQPQAQPINVTVQAPQQAAPAVAPVYVNIPEQKPVQAQAQPVNVSVQVPQEALTKAVKQAMPAQVAQQPIVQQVQPQPVNVTVQVPQEALTKAVKEAMPAQAAQQVQPQMQPIYVQQPMQNIPVAMPIETSSVAPMGGNVNVVAPVVLPDAPAQVEAVEEVAKEPRDWEIRCPNCGKSLKVNDKSLFHRCPTCTKIFQLDRGSRPVKSAFQKRMDQGSPEGVANLEQRMNAEKPAGMAEGLPENTPPQEA